MAVSMSPYREGSTAEGWVWGSAVRSLAANGERAMCNEIQTSRGTGAVKGRPSLLLKGKTCSEARTWGRGAVCLSL